jgi:hypothetical protein
MSFIFIDEVASGLVVSGDIANAAVTSGSFASGVISRFALSSGAVNSGHVGSGLAVTYSRNVMDDTLSTAETVSGNFPVAIESGGRAVVAQAASGLRMPAIGIAATNALSGESLNYVTFGRLQLLSGMDILFSGQAGRPVYVAAAGGLTATKPLATSLAQRVGIAVSGGVMVNPSIITQSGDAGIQSGA